MSMPRSGMVAFLAALFVLAGVTAASAAAGGPDQTFGSGGIVTRYLLSRGADVFRGPRPGDRARAAPPRQKRSLRVRRWGARPFLRSLALSLPVAPTVSAGR